MHADELPYWDRGIGSPKEREEWLEGIKARWRAAQEPATPPSNPEPPESEPDDELPSRVVEALEKTAKEIFSIATSRDRLEDKSETLPPKAPLVDTVKQSKTPNKRKRASKSSKKAHLSKTQNAGVWLALGFAVLERGLDVIGYHDLVIGGLLFVLAFGFFVRWFWLWERAARWRMRWRAIIILTGAVVYSTFVGFQLYKQAKEEVSAKSPTPAPIISPSTQVTPTPLVARSASPSPSPQSTPVASPSTVNSAASPSPSPTPTMRAAGTSKIVSAVPIDPAQINFNRRIPLKGGSRQRLSDVLTEGGYKGSMLLQELTIRNLDSDDVIYYGESDVNEANGNPLDQGSAYTWRVGGQQDIIDARQIYLFTGKDGRIGITLRSVAQ
jgi:hypothetical protein